MTARLSVLIPYYNEPNGLLKSLKSIAFKSPLDVVIVDDGSKTPYSKEKILAVGEGKFSFHFIKNDVNQGLERTLNRGLKYIYEKLPSCSYVARLDCGDINVNDRLNQQLLFLETHPNVHVVGAQINIVDMNGEIIYRRVYQVHHKQIMKFMYLRIMITASMYKLRPIIEKVGYYPLDYDALEDHAYFFRIGQLFEMANLPEVLYHYEMNPNSISSKKRRRQMKSRLKFIWNNFYFGYYPIYGFLLTLILLYTPRNITAKIRTVLKYGK